MNKTDNLKLKEVSAEAMSSSVYGMSQLASSGSGSGSGSTGSGSGDGSGSGSEGTVAASGGFRVSYIKPFDEFYIYKEGLESICFRSDGPIIYPHEDKNVKIEIKVVANNGYNQATFNSIDLIGAGAVIGMDPQATSHLITVKALSADRYFSKDVDWTAYRRQDYSI